MRTVKKSVPKIQVAKKIGMIECPVYHYYCRYVDCPSIVHCDIHLSLIFLKRVNANTHPTSRAAVG